MLTETEKKVKEWMGEAVPPALDRAYNLAIDHAIHTAREHYVSGREDQPINVMIDSIVIKLQKLKS